MPLEPLPHPLGHGQVPDDQEQHGADGQGHGDAGPVAHAAGQGRDVLLDGEQRGDEGEGQERRGQPGQVGQLPVEAVAVARLLDAHRRHRDLDELVHPGLVLVHGRQRQEEVGPVGGGRPRAGEGPPERPAEVHAVPEAGEAGQVGRLAEDVDERLGDHLAVHGHRAPPEGQPAGHLVDTGAVPPVAGLGQLPVDLAQARLDVVRDHEPLGADEVEQGAHRDAQAWPGIGLTGINVGGG